jgi:polyhydroxybutyrate depolymerase
MLSRVAGAVLVPFMVSAAALSCGSSSGGSSPANADGGDTSSPSTGCGGTAAAPGTKTIMLMSGGQPRTYLLHVPPGYSGKPTPLVIDIHGFLSNASQQEGWSAMDTVADREGFLVAYPNGAGSPQSWNAGDCCEFTDSGRDDVAFISALIDDVGKKSCVALDRVYATGMSNGGFMSHNLACNLSDRIAAIGPVAGVLGIPPAACTPGRAVPVMEFHGTADPLVPYDGGSPSASLWGYLYPTSAPPTFRSVSDTVAFWRTQNGCSDTPMQTYASGDATCQTYGGCKDGAVVTLCTIMDGGHTWPGGSTKALPSIATTIVGKMSSSIDASSQLWDFFKKYRLPAGFDGGTTTPPPYPTAGDAGAQASDASGG